MSNLDPPIPVIWPEWCYENNGKESEQQDSVMNNNNREAKNKNVNFVCKGKETSALATPGALTSSHLEKHSTSLTNSEASTNANEGSGTKVTNHVSTKCANGSSKRGSSPPSSSSKSSTYPSSFTSSYSKTAVPYHPYHTSSHFSGSTTGSSTSHVLSITTSTTTAHFPYDRFSPAALGVNSGFSRSGGDLKQVESLPTRNCSDLIRSLAAKYNDNSSSSSSSSICSPNDYLSNFNNGFSRSLLPAICLFKGKPPPRTTLNSIYVTSPAKVVQTNKNPEPSIAPVTAKIPQEISPTGTHSTFPNNGISGTRGFPLVDVSSTQMLLSMVRNASVAQQSHLETYLRGTVKRHADTSSSPLDLSSSVATKRQRTEGWNLGVKTRCPEGENDKASPPSTALPMNIKLPSIHSPDSNHHAERVPSGASCGDRECPSLEGVLRWTVEDVCDFVRSVDLCAEYVEAFREHRIDGSSLPLLTEDHLTTSIHMKLGPALKLRSVLARKLGSCGVCFHCIHCHSSPATGEKRSTVASCGQ